MKWIALTALLLVSACTRSEQGEPAPSEAEAAGQARMSAAPAAPSAATALTSTARMTGERLPSMTTLSAYFDCLRENRAVVLAAHRGGPTPGFPENALETLQHGAARGVHVFEVDVAESRDGALFLMHDRSLSRTTTLQGPVVDTDWTDIARSRLIDNDGTVTSFHPPLLADVLTWAVANDTIVELDRKPSTSFRNIVAVVRAAGAERHAILITYDDNDVRTVARAAPDLMLTASVRGEQDISRLETLGVQRENLIAWTGTRDPDRAAFRRLAAAGVEPAFGTLGRPGERLDDLWLADGDVSEFETLIGDGVVLLATDIALDLAPLLKADDRARAACSR